jgi:hypothetical protein
VALAISPTSAFFWLVDECQVFDDLVHLLLHRVLGHDSPDAGDDCRVRESCAWLRDDLKDVLVPSSPMAIAREVPSEGPFIILACLNTFADSPVSLTQRPAVSAATDPASVMPPPTLAADRMRCRLRDFARGVLQRSGTRGH